MVTFVGFPDWLERGEEDVREWLHMVARDHSCRIDHLQYSFVNDDEITRINTEHLKHNYATDIITFGYSEGSRVSGEVFISLDTVTSNAQGFNVSRSDELDRVMAHGLLHLIGFNDSTEGEKQRMREEEEKCLILRPKKLSNG